MKKSLVLLSILVASVALLTANAFAVVVHQPGSRYVEWGMDCDSTSGFEVPDITITQSYPGEFQDDLADDGSVTLTYSVESAEEQDWDVTGAELDGIEESDDWDVSVLNVDAAATAAGADGVVILGDDAVNDESFDDAATAELDEDAGFTVNGVELEATGTGDNDNCGDNACIAICVVTVAYDPDAAGDLFECDLTQEVLLGTSDNEPDICHTTLKFPYVVSNNDDPNWVSVLVVSSNSSTCEDRGGADVVDFYAWDEAGSYKGKRGPYYMALGDGGPGQVVIVPDDMDPNESDAEHFANPEFDWGVTAENTKNAAYTNGWWNLDDDVPTTWKSWSNTDGQVTGRGQVIAIINQNYAEGYSAIFRVGADGLSDMGAELAIKDLTNYETSYGPIDEIGLSSETNSVEVYIASVLGGSYSLSDGASLSAVGNTGIVSIGSRGQRERGTAGLSDAYYH